MYVLPGRSPVPRANLHSWRQPVPASPKLLRNLWFLERPFQSSRPTSPVSKLSCFVFVPLFKLLQHLAQIFEGSFTLLFVDLRLFECAQHFTRRIEQLF